jgi:hypothetical protein
MDLIQCDLPIDDIFVAFNPEKRVWIQGRSNKRLSNKERRKLCSSSAEIHGNKKL